MTIQQNFSHFFTKQLEERGFDPQKNARNYAQKIIEQQTSALYKKTSEFFYEDSLLQAIRFDQEKDLDRYKNLSVIDQITLGIGSGIKRFIIGAIAATIARQLFLSSEQKKKLQSEEEEVKNEWRSSASAANSIWLYIPLTEEFAFRICLQNIIQASQKWVPRSEENLALKWVSSKSFRILLTNGCFAVFHLIANPNPATSFLQVGTILLTPVFSSLYEKTNSPLPSLVAHIVNNALMVFAVKCEKSNRT